MYPAGSVRLSPRFDMEKIMVYYGTGRGSRLMASNQRIVVVYLFARPASFPASLPLLAEGLILDTILETCANQDGHLTGWVNKPRARANSNRVGNAPLAGQGKRPLE